ncbi:unnamed protein product [Colias eurytheme]|nr:unnamed protein product [Colias eurytheme]
MQVVDSEGRFRAAHRRGPRPPRGSGRCPLGLRPPAASRPTRARDSAATARHGDLALKQINHPVNACAVITQTWNQL